MKKVDKYVFVPWRGVSCFDKRAQNLHVAGAILVTVYRKSLANAMYFVTFSKKIIYFAVRTSFFCKKI